MKQSRARVNRWLAPVWVGNFDPSLGYRLLLYKLVLADISDLRNWIFLECCNNSLNELEYVFLDESNLGINLTHYQTTGPRCVGLLSLIVFPPVTSPFVLLLLC